MIVFETPQSSRVKMKVTLERTDAGLETIELDELKLLNPYSLLVTIPSKQFLSYKFKFLTKSIIFLDCCFSVNTMASMRLEIDGANRGCRTIRLESNLSQMDQLLKMTIDPIEFMCQAAGVNSNCKNQLDDLLAKQMIQNMPKSGFDLLNGSSLVNDLQILPKGKSF